jgi:hypothetical protein
MSSSEHGPDRATEVFSELSAGAILRRVRDMMLLWLFFGAVCGACLDLDREGTLLRIVSSVLAGMIVLPVLGAFLGLAGGRVRPTLLGGFCGGVLAGVVGAVAGAVAPLYLVSFGVILGGLAGGTIGVVFWWVNLVGRALSLAVRRG